jgi:hypothetical protein
MNNEVTIKLILSVLQLFLSEPVDEIVSRSRIDISRKLGGS